MALSALFSPKNKMTSSTSTTASEFGDLPPEKYAKKLVPGWGTIKPSWSE